MTKQEAEQYAAELGARLSDEARAKGTSGIVIAVLHDRGAATAYAGPEGNVDFVTAAMGRAFGPGKFQEVDRLSAGPLN